MLWSLYLGLVSPRSVSPVLIPDGKSLGLLSGPQLSPSHFHFSALLLWAAGSLLKAVFIFFILMESCFFLSCPFFITA